jgi:hypothetical protein
VSDAVFLSDRSVEGRSDCGHFDLADWGACQDKVSGDPRIECVCDTVGWWGDLTKVASRRSLPDLGSGEPRVRPLPEETLGRGVNSSGTAVPTWGRGRARRDCVPWLARSWPEPCTSVSAACADGGYQPCLVVLGVFLITIPDNYVLNKSAYYSTSKKVFDRLKWLLLTRSHTVMLAQHLL